MTWNHPWAEIVPGPDGTARTVLPAAPTDADAVRDMFAQHPTGIAAICALTPEGPQAMVATSFALGISFAPPLVLFSAQQSSRTWPLIAGAAHIGVSVLGEENAAAVRTLASRSGDRFAGLVTAQTDGGAILIDGARMWLECRVHSDEPLGDHRLIVLEVLGGSSHRGTAPLIYHDGGVGSLAAS
ncbi:flavin reductase family protein [Microbacterium sp. BG28]|uniref:flavin reductase family protein n=1 Tax=Microbacterium sp. BG28 TaxID=3097356 RepID=UPI002A5B083B|nr:flavin reductase family protein [Microbacterium sp. BG28]MDY0830181.1 flavin reductase family protein [Microbacterium sp. BG28]